MDITTEISVVCVGFQQSGEKWCFFTRGGRVRA